MPFQFLRERFTKLFVIAKPAFELLDERLNVAASEDVKVFTEPLIQLAKNHGRFETAVLCAVIENVACLALLQNYGTCGAVERTLPVLGARAQEIFFTTSVFILDYLIALFLKASKHIEHTSAMKVALKIKKPVLTFIFILHCVLRLLFGEDYLLATIGFLKALPGYVLNFAKAEVQRRMYVPCMKRIREMQKISPIFAFSCRRLVELAVFTILGISILFAFLSVYALDQNSCVPIIDEEYSQAFIVDTEGYDTENDDIDPDITLNDPGIETSRVLKITYIEDNLASDYEILNCDDSVDKDDTMREDCEWKEVEVGKNVGKEVEEKEKENEEILSEEKEQIKEEEERVGVKVHVENDGASINESRSFLAFPSMDSVTCFSEEESIRIASDISIAMSEDLFDMRDVAAHVEEEEVSDGKETKASVIHTKEEELKISQVSLFNLFLFCG